jgi:nucleoid-associated protein YejK
MGENDKQVPQEQEQSKPIRYTQEDLQETKEIKLNAINETIENSEEKDFGTQWNEWANSVGAKKGTVDDLLNLK